MPFPGPHAALLALPAPRTLVLLPPAATPHADADTPGKVAVSQPWMVRISKMWFCGSKKVLEPREEDEQDVIEWEQQQMKRGRLSLLHFWLEVSGATTTEIYSGGTALLVLVMDAASGRTSMQLCCAGLCLSRLAGSWLLTPCMASTLGLLRIHVLRCAAAHMDRPPTFTAARMTTQRAPLLPAAATPRGSAGP